MIDPVLKKFGLSEARRSLKYLNNNSKTPIKSKQQTAERKINQTQPLANKNNAFAPTVRPFTTTRQPQSINTLERLVHYLQSQYNGVCPNHSHLQNKVKFICLNQACSNNFGCAECFLYKHSDHSKAEIGTCVRELQELDLFMGESYEMIFSQKNQIKQQFIKSIEVEIDHMCDEFHRNLQFLKKYIRILCSKALQQIDEHLFSKYEGLEALNNYRSHKSKELHSESKLISELMKIDIRGIEKDLNFQLKELSYQKLNYQPVVKYFQEMNGALGNFMAEFKKCFPKIYSYSSDAKMGNSKNMEKSNLNNTFSDVRSNQFENTIKLSQNNSLVN